MTAVCVPFLRQVDGVWKFVWADYLDRARTWRKEVSKTLSVPAAKELHGVKLASGRGNFNKGKFPFDKPKACAVYRRALELVSFLPDKSIMSVSCSRDKELYGHERLEAAMLALFQRMRRKCTFDKANAMTFFDQGHPEYRALYRKAQVYLPTGSKVGAWMSGDQSKNMPLDMFVEDGNEKDSKFCQFTQLADLIAYSAFLKIKAERGELEQWQLNVNAGNIYDSVPKRLLNLAASGKQPKDAIVRLT